MRALYAHLWTGADVPIEYIRLKMCRDVYHCTPTELDAVPWRVIAEDLTMMAVETEVQKRWQKRRS